MCQFVPVLMVLMEIRSRYVVAHQVQTQFIKKKNDQLTYLIN